MSQNDLFLSHAPRSEIRSPEQYGSLSQGAEANHQGRWLEEQVVALMKGRGAVLTPYKKYQCGNSDMFSPRMIIPQYPYKSLVGNTTRRIDLVYVHGVQGPRVAIECKVQDGNGSTDEKLAFTALNAMKWNFVDYIWIILSGKGFKKGWAEFLEDFPKRYGGSKSFRVFPSVDELRRPIKLLVESGDAAGR